MWALLKGLFRRSTILNASLGDVTFESPEVRGQASESFLQWRVKRDLVDNGYFIGLKMEPDAFGGPVGLVKHYISFDIERAQLVRNHLDRCIAEYYRVTSRTPPEMTGSIE
jgi:hypothetical protein